MPKRTDDLAPENISPLDRLVRSIDLAEGFALFFARCNIPVLRSELMLVATQQLAVLGIEVVEVAFEDEPANVRERLVAADRESGAPVSIELPAQLQPLAIAEPSTGYSAVSKHAVFVTGLEYGIPFDQPNSRVLAELNLGRDAFPRDVPHPLVIWLPDYAVTAVARFAPDFWAWRSGVFEFETGEAERTAAFEQSIWRDRPWQVLTNLTQEARLLRRRQLESLLDDYRDLPPDSRVFKERGDILADLGHVCAASQNYGEAAVYYNQALALYRQVNDKGGEAEMLTSLGDALGDKHKALAFYEQALPLQHQEGDRVGEAATLNNIGWVHSALGDERKALDFYEQALSLQRQMGDRGGEATTLNRIGWAYRRLDDMLKALEFFEQALWLQRQMDDRSGEASTLNNIGVVYSSVHENRNALNFYEQALLLRRQVGDRRGESITRYCMGMVYEDMGDLTRAEEELQIVVELDAAIEHPDLASDRAALERVQAKRAGKR